MIDKNITGLVVSRKFYSVLQVKKVDHVLLLLFGFGPHAAPYNDSDIEQPYRGDIWELPGVGKVITISDWA